MGGAKVLSENAKGHVGFQGQHDSWPVFSQLL